MGARLLLEGGDLAELMAHVREEFGPHARIIRAERVRTGGIAGFFAKESYELTVDVPEVPPQRLVPRMPPPPARAGLEDLLAAADEADALHSPSSPPLALVPKPEPEPARQEIVARPQEAAQAAVPRAATAPTPFTSVLEQVRTLADEETPAFTALRAESAPRPDDPAPVAPSAAPVPDVPSQATGPTSPGPARPATAARSAAAPVSVVAAVTATDTAREQALRTSLTGLGLPEALLRARPLTLAAVLDHIPTPPPLPRHAGQVLAIVGSSADVHAVAALLVERMRLEPPDVVHLGVTRIDPHVAADDRPTRLTTPTAVSSWRSRAGAAMHPWLVVLPVDGDANDRQIAADTLAAARPDQVWAVVDARTKPDDARRWIAQIGARRPVDALAVRGLLDTAAPGTVLGLPHPVAWVDGLPASRLVWAAALGQGVDDALH